MADGQRPTFVESWFDDAKADYQRRGLRSLFPTTLILCAGLSAAAAYFVPNGFFFPSKWDVAATVYTGLLAFNALTLALAWGAIGRIYESIAQPGFSSFLKDGGVLSTYLFYISFVHVVQVIAAFVTLVSLVMLFLPLGPLYDKVSLAATLAATLYALRWAFGAVSIVQDLSWYYATYDSMAPDEKQKLRLAVSNDHTEISS